MPLGYTATPMLSTHPDSLAIVCGADAQYLRPLAVMLRSVVANLSPDRSAAVYVFDGGVDPADKTEVTAGWNSPRVTVHWIPAHENAFDGLPLWGRMPVTTYYKLSLADLLPAPVRRAIWLDCDLVVVSDLARLWDTTCGDHHVMAAQDRVVPLVSSAFGISHHAQLGIPATAKYFNAGVMVVNVDKWRQQQVGSQALHYLREFRESVYFWDQEGLNAVLAGKWGELDPRWNYNAGVPNRAPRAGARQRELEPWIVHYAGNLKPWLYESRDPHRQLYFHYLDMTPWRGWRPRHSLSGLVLSTYESSALRRWLYPLEPWVMRLSRAVSRRYVPPAAREGAAGPSPVRAHRHDRN
jgi:lipopolysaccharide biosynthesis glycosyltransferase